MTYLTSGARMPGAEVLESAVFPDQYDEKVLVKDIEFYALCEHHLLPFHGRAHIAYIPDGRIVGLSRLPRLLEIHARRFQVQERLTREVADKLENTRRPRGVAIRIEAARFCLMVRGVEKQDPRTVTSTTVASSGPRARCGGNSSRPSRTRVHSSRRQPMAAADATVRSAQNAKLTIGALSRATAIAVETLRTWEGRYGFPAPERKPSGHRVYDLSAAPRLRRIVLATLHRGGAGAGLQMAALILASAVWRLLFLEMNVPARQIAAVANERKADVVRDLAALDAWARHGVGHCATRSVPA